MEPKVPSVPVNIAAIVLQVVALASVAFRLNAGEGEANVGDTVDLSNFALEMVASVVAQARMIWASWKDWARTKIS